jgi:CheY-like chemotaxis protein
VVVSAGRVLIVEDNPVNLRLAQFLLEKRGFTVRKAGSGAECLAEMAQEVPDIVLMDIQLPGEDGLAVTRKIRSDPRLAHIIVVALTAHAMAGDREKILGAGCDGYIAKPVDPQSLASEVARYLQQGRLKSA